MNTLSNAERRIVNTLVAKSFANRRGHGSAATIVHRQMKRDDLAALLIAAIKQSKKLHDHSAGEVKS